MADPHDHLRTTELAPLVEEHGELTIEPADDLFERLVVSIVNQQLSTEAADTIRGRLFDQFEVTPEGILAADPEDLQAVGVSTQKTRYVRNIAEWFDAEDVSHERFATMSDEDVLAELTSITGVGDWTAKMFLLFGLGREDVFPVEDLGVRRGMEAFFGDESRAEMRERAEAWRPYRSYSALYLWRHR